MNDKNKRPVRILSEEEFYYLSQNYRHAPLARQELVTAAYDLLYGRYAALGQRVRYLERAMKREQKKRKR